MDSPRSVWREEGGGYDSRQGWEDDYRFILGRLSLVRRAGSSLDRIRYDLLTV